MCWHSHTHYSCNVTKQRLLELISGVPKYFHQPSLPFFKSFKWRKKSECLFLSSIWHSTERYSTFIFITGSLALTITLKIRITIIHWRRQYRQTMYSYEHQRKTHRLKPKSLPAEVRSQKSGCTTSQPQLAPVPKSQRRQGVLNPMYLQILCFSWPNNQMAKQFPCESHGVIVNLSHPHSPPVSPLPVNFLFSSKVKTFQHHTAR